MVPIEKLIVLSYTMQFFNQQQAVRMIRIFD